VLSSLLAIENRKQKRALLAAREFITTQFKDGAAVFGREAWTSGYNK
jgi:hypothetical protein